MSSVVETRRALTAEIVTRSWTPTENPMRPHKRQVANGRLAITLPWMALLIGAVLSGCVTPSPQSEIRQRLSRYVGEAQYRLQACVLAVRDDTQRPEQPLSSPWRQLCRSDEAQLEALFHDAERAVRMQRGTSMYLRRYHQEWTALMQQLAREDFASGSNIASTRTNEITVESLQLIAGKLIQGS